jgi:hypothetical protein
MEIRRARCAMFLFRRIRADQLALQCEEFAHFREVFPRMGANGRELQLFILKSEVPATAELRPPTQSWNFCLFASISVHSWFFSSALAST